MARIKSPNKFGNARVRRVLGTPARSARWGYVNPFSTRLLYQAPE
jgi:hypothetical protein